MSTLVLEVKFIDDTQSVDKEFADLTALSVWLHGQRESDFDWLCLHDNNNDYVFEGWSDIYQYIRENTGAPKWPVPVDNVLNHSLIPHDLSECGEACNCMKCSEATIERSEMVNPSKSSSIALRVVELNLPVVDVGESDLPRVERFDDLPDGTLFYLAQTYAYGGRQKYQKVMEDGGLHNAVLYTESYSGIRVPDMQLVIRA